MAVETVEEFVQHIAKQQVTVADIAKQMGISRNTLYRRLKECGVDATKLRDENGRLSQYGVSVIAGACDNDTSRGTEKPVTVGVSDTQKAAEIDTQSAVDVSKLSLRVAQLETQCEALQRENDMLRSMLDDAKQQRDKAQEERQRDKESAAVENAKLIAALEAAQQMQQRMLPETVERGRGGWFARLFGR